MKSLEIQNQYFPVWKVMEFEMPGKLVTARYRKGLLSQRTAIANGRYCHVMCKLRILALGSVQRLVYRLGSGLGLVLVLVCTYCSACADFCDSGPLR